jgi:cytochrome b subunit of formate dehydrogenase
MPLVLGLMLAHNLGDWIRKVFRLRLRPAWNGEFRIPTPASVRMLRFERIERGLLILTFTSLVWTGFALKYPNEWWARPLLAWESGWAVRGTIHRVAGVVLIGLSLAHAVSLIVDRNLRAHWKILLPLRADASEAAAGFAYNLGLLRRRPRISSHSYVEKLEYWAVVWGTGVMAITGVMLWANTFVLTWLPKVVLNGALSIHYFEAVLATLAILIWHFYLVIFDPEVYPVDPAWLTGRGVRPGEAEEEGTTQEW